MKRLLTLLAAGAACSAIAAAPAAATHSWNNYHWARTANPFTLKVGNNVTSLWASEFGTSNADWTASSVLNLTEVPGTANKRCSMTAGTVQVCNRTYGNNGWLGLATINITGGTHITQGSAKMNDTYFNTATYNNPNEKLHVMCQEVGHTFGLGHTSEDGSSQNTCMDYFSNTGANAASTLSTHPNSHDYGQLETTYGPLDSSTTLASSTATSPGMAGRSDAKPYRSERSDHGKHSELREYFADGTVRVTDVRWANGPRTVIDRG
ncbi:MAG: hypothetical protein WKF96_13445 [Solirubrobacteraceae bacterium]